MATQDNFFREKALESSSSPEQLDRVMQALRPMNWLPLAVLGSLVATAVLWGIVGRVPITSDNSLNKET